MAKINFSIRDYSMEMSTFGVFTADLLDAAALQTAVDGVTAGVIATRTDISEVVAVSGAAPVSPYAQRELGLRVYYSDNVTARNGSFTIAAPDLDALTLTGDGVLLTDGVAAPMEILVTWLNANARSSDGNAITVNAARVVGRNT